VSDVDAEVAARLEVVDEVASPPEAAAPDVEEPVLRLEALLAEEVDLQLPDLLPGPADEHPVLARRDRLRVERELRIVRIFAFRLDPSLDLAHG